MEEQFEGSAVIPEDKVTLKLTLTRGTTSIDKQVTKILGAVG
jgi:hypothetical protein